MQIKWNQKAGAFIVTWGDTSVEVGAVDPDVSEHPRVVKIYGKGPFGPSRKKAPKKKTPSHPTEDSSRPMPIPPPGVMGYAVITRKGVVPRKITSEAELERVVQEALARSVHLKKASPRKFFSLPTRKVKSPWSAPILDVGLTNEGAGHELDQLTKSILRSRSGVVGVRLYKK